MDHTTDPRVTRIKELCSDSGLTQKEIACSLDMSQSSVSQYLNRRIPMNTDTVLKFARLFNVKPITIDPSLTL